MCGIVGYLSGDGAPVAGGPALDADPSGRLGRMLATLVHRGPDDDGQWLRGTLALGFRRLSIIDLAGGHQPIENETGDVAVVGNGEIYNFRELRAELEAAGHRFRTGSDMETLVHLYEEHGERLVERLVGMFAFAIADLRDPARPRLLLARDRLGIKPLYWARDGAGLAFASEAKALLAVGAGDRRLRRGALLSYLVQGYVLGTPSAWEGIERLPPGCTLTLEAGAEPRVRRYWDLPTEGLRGPAGDEEVLEWVDRVVADRLLADVPLGAFLSAGIDSTAVVTSMARALPDPVVACTVGFEERSHDELEGARATARRLGAVHHTRVLEPDPTLAVEVLPWFYDEPLADPSTVPTYLVSKVAREHVTVALSGDGGDEVFGGYRRYVHDLAENRLRAAVGSPGRALARLGGRIYPRLERAPRFLRARTFLANVGSDPALAYFHSVGQMTRAEALELLSPDLRAALADEDPFHAFAEHYHRPRGVDPLYRAQYVDFHTNLPDRILAKVDRASMAVSLEARVPLLDHRFVERFANLPAPEKVQGGRGKHRLRESQRERIPADILDGTKRGFDTPLRAWIRGPLAGAVDEALESLPSAWFDRETLRRRAAEHRGGGRDHGRLLWSLLVLEHWRRRHEVRDVL